MHPKPAFTQRFVQIVVEVEGSGRQPFMKPWSGMKGHACCKILYIVVLSKMADQLYYEGACLL